MSRILPRFKVYPNGTVVEDKSWDDALLRIHNAIKCTKKRLHKPFNINLINKEYDIH